MKDNDWIPGAIIAGVIILAIGIGGIAYAIHKHNQSLNFVGEPSSSSAANCISADQAATNEGKSTCVELTVGYTYVSAAGNAYLDQYDGSGSNGYGFSVWMPSSDSFGSSEINQYANKTVDVTGTITKYDGEPEIEVTNPSQITLVQ
jgi:hypothetical protein